MQGPCESMQKCAAKLTSVNSSHGTISPCFSLSNDRGKIALQQNGKINYKFKCSISL